MSRKASPRLPGCALHVLTSRREVGAAAEKQLLEAPCSCLVERRFTKCPARTFGAWNTGLFCGAARALAFRAEAGSDCRSCA